MTNATEEQAKRWSKKKEKMRGGGGIKHITVVTEKKDKIMPRAIYKVVLVSSME
jgi:hypothetical protein